MARARTRSNEPDGATSDRDRRWARFYALVRKIPRGRISTYGDIGALAGNPRLARHVGIALSALEKSPLPQRVPWHRVLGARSGGRAGISIRDPIDGTRQRKLLEAEGVEFDARGTVSYADFGWPARPRKSSPPNMARATKNSTVKEPKAKRSKAKRSKAKS